MGGVYCTGGSVGVVRCPGYRSLPCHCTALPCNLVLEWDEFTGWDTLINQLSFYIHTNYKIIRVLIVTNITTKISFG